MNLRNSCYEVFRQYDEIRRVTREFDEICKATQAYASIKQMTRAYDELRQVTRPWEGMRELTESFAEAARPPEGLNAATGLRECFASEQTEAVEVMAKEVSTMALTSDASIRALVESQQDCYDMASRAQQIQEAMEAWQVKAAKVLDFDLSKWLAPYTASLFSSERFMIDRLGIDYSGSLGFNLEELVGPTLDAYTAWRLPLGFGLMAGTAEASLLSWPTAPGRGSPFPPLSSAFMRRRSEVDDVAQVLEIHCQVDCRFCGEPIIVDDEDRYLDSEGRVIINLEIIPLCPTCLRLDNQDPEYFLRQLGRVEGRGIQRPQLTLIRGSSEATTAPRGKEVLRLVKPEEDAE